LKGVPNRDRGRACPQRPVKVKDHDEKVFEKIEQGAAEGGGEDNR